MESEEVDAEPNEPNDSFTLTLELRQSDMEALYKLENKAESPEELELFVRIIVTARKALGAVQDRLGTNDDDESKPQRARSSTVSDGTGSTKLGERRDWCLTSHPPILRFSRRMLITTRCGGILEKRGWMSRATLCFFLMYALTFLLPRETLTGFLEKDGEDVVVTERLFPKFALLIRGPCIFLVGILQMHRCNRYIFFRVFFSLEGLLIFFFCIVQHWIVVFHRLLIIGPDNGYGIASILVSTYGFVSHIPAFLMISSLDSLRYSRVYKCLFNLFVVIVAGQQMYHNRCSNRIWGESTDCSISFFSKGFTGCTRREVYLTCLAQLLVLVVKSGIVYMTGETFALFRPAYIPESKHHEFGKSPTVAFSQSTSMLLLDDSTHEHPRTDEIADDDPACTESNDNALCGEDVGPSPSSSGVGQLHLTTLPDYGVMESDGSRLSL